MSTRAICGNCRNLLCRKCHQYHTPDSMTHRNALRYCRLAKGQGMGLAKREFTSPACTMIDNVSQPLSGSPLILETAQRSQQERGAGGVRPPSSEPGRTAGSPHSAPVTARQEATR